MVSLADDLSLPTVPRVLAVCADDFGLAPGISHGIAQLAVAGRIAAVSCIATEARWHVDATLLHHLPQAVQCGLHINLTEGVPVSPDLARIWPRFPSFVELAARAYMGILPRAALRAEMSAQLDRFQEAVGAAPRHVDGHQHVHQLPVLRHTLLDLLHEQVPMAAVRSARDLRGPGFGTKRWVISHAGARALARLLTRRQVAHNAVLLGAYDLRQSDYRSLVQGWLRAVPPEGAMLFCHPGAAPTGGLGDPLARARQRELRYLGSDAFLHDLAHARVTLGPVWLEAGSAHI